MVKGCEKMSEKRKTVFIDSAFQTEDSRNYKGIPISLSRRLSNRGTTLQDVRARDMAERLRTYIQGANPDENFNLKRKAYKGMDNMIGEYDCFTYAVTSRQRGLVSMLVPSKIVDVKLDTGSCPSIVINIYDKSLQDDELFVSVVETLNTDFLGK